MARGTRQRRNYLTCTAGKWRERVSQDTPGARSRITTPMDGSPGKQVWEIVDDYVEGEIIDIQHTSHPDYEDRLEITIRDGSEVLVLQMRWDSGYGMAVLSKLRNVDIARPVMFLPYYFEEERKVRMTLKQEGMKIPTFYPQKDPKGFPPYQEGMTKQQVTRWKLDVMDFLEAELDEHVRPLLPEREATDEIEEYNDRGQVAPSTPPHDTAPGHSEAGSENSPPSDPGDPGPEVDDLPF